MNEWVVLVGFPDSVYIGVLTQTAVRVQVQLLTGWICQLHSCMGTERHHQ